MNTPLFARAALVVMLIILAVGQYRINSTLSTYHNQAVKARAVQNQLITRNAEALTRLADQIQAINQTLRKEANP